jgi:hypothetical protein
MSRDSGIYCRCCRLARRGISGAAISAIMGGEGHYGRNPALSPPPGIELTDAIRLGHLGKE